MAAAAKVRELRDSGDHSGGSGRIQKSLTDQIGRCQITAPIGGRVAYADPIEAGAVVRDGAVALPCCSGRKREYKGGNQGTSRIKEARACENSVDQHRELRRSRHGGERLAPAGRNHVLDDGVFEIKQLLTPYVPQSLDFDQGDRRSVQREPCRRSHLGRICVSACTRCGPFAAPLLRRSIRSLSTRKLLGKALPTSAIPRGVPHRTRRGGRGFSRPRRRFSVSWAGCTRSITPATSSH